MRRIKLLGPTLALTAIAVLVTGTALAALATGGNTIAGPGKNSVGVQNPFMLVDGLDDEDVCVTVQNVSDKVGLLNILIITEAGQETRDFSKGKTASLCATNGRSVEATCMGPKSCSFFWRVDKR